MALSDTTPEASAVLAQVYRLMPSGKKWLLLGRAYTSMRMLHAAGVRHRRPWATDQDVIADWVERVSKLPALPIREGCPVTQLPMNIEEARKVIRILQGLGIPYALGGSMASSIHGVPRSTQDSDIVVRPFLGLLKNFVAAFPAEYYVSPVAIEDAHRNGSSFNVINLDTGFKTDLFIATPSSFAAQALSRSESLTLPDNPAEPVSVVTAEDILLLKLWWYRLGNETSDRQWNDILGVLQTKQAAIDRAYLQQWAATLRVADLLQRALQDAG